MRIDLERKQVLLDAMKLVKRNTPYFRSFVDEDYDLATLGHGDVDPSIKPVLELYLLAGIHDLNELCGVSDLYLSCNPHNYMGEMYLAYIIGIHNKENITPFMWYIELRHGQEFVRQFETLINKLFEEHKGLCDAFVAVYKGLDSSLKPTMAVVLINLNNILQPLCYTRNYFDMFQWKETADGVEAIPALHEEINGNTHDQVIGNLADIMPDSIQNLHPGRGYIFHC